MSEFDNTNRGVLFKGREKKNEKGPDYTGTLNVGGTDYRLAAWLREGSKGRFMSLSIEPKDKDRRAEPVRKATSDDDVDSDIPF